MRKGQSGNQWPWSFINVKKRAYKTHRKCFGMAEGEACREGGADLEDWVSRLALLV